jgi:hypothetical protein
MVRLGNNVNDSIPLSEMKDGQIGIITEWADYQKYAGRIVQRYDNILIALGRSSGSSWSRIFAECSEHHRVRLLQNDEALYVDNDDLR